jgi:protein RecA
MSERKELLIQEEAPEMEPQSNYFVSDKPLQFFSSGSTLLDQVLGGGWVLGRIANLVGDRSSGKTLLAIEACANFIHTYSDGLIRYCEAEAAFDLDYAASLGMPVDKVSFASDVFTVESLFNDLEQTLSTLGDKPCLYILDSLDALSDKAEQERKIDDGSFGAAKAKKLGELFRRLVKIMENKKMCLIVISQIRDKIGISFGETKQRSGGHALDFYSSQIVWLADVGKIKKTMSGVERVIGVNIVAKNKKNKIGLPYRDCEFPIIFGYGVDDLASMAEWVIKVKDLETLQSILPDLSLGKTAYKRTFTNIRDEGGDRYINTWTTLRNYVIQEWRNIETGFLPKARKY